MRNPAVVETPTQPADPTAEPWFDDACILDMDYFVKTISGIKAKGVRPDLIGSIIAHYSSKWLPDLSPAATETTAPSTIDNPSSPESVTATWMKKRFFVETLVGLLPCENDAVPCNFLLRLLRVGGTVGVGPAHRAELERRAARRLDQAELRELLIPAFSHTCGTLLDVDLVTRLVKRFLLGFEEATGSGAAVAKVAKLVDGYLAEAAVDSNLGVGEFIDLAGVLPAHARATDDGIYRAIDTYLKAHPSLTKPERKLLCRLIDTRKLSTEASLHASQNERLPVRAVLQVLFTEQSKLTTRQLDWSGPFGVGSRSSHPSPATTGGIEARCMSKREANVQQMEIKRLKEEVMRLQSQCNTMQAQMERLVEKKKGFFKWRKIGLIPSFRSHGDRVMSNEIVEEECRSRGERVEFARQTTPMEKRSGGRLGKGNVPPKLRNSLP